MRSKKLMICAILFVALINLNSCKNEDELNYGNSPCGVLPIESPDLELFPTADEDYLTGSIPEEGTSFKIILTDIHNAGSCKVNIDNSENTDWIYVPDSDSDEVITSLWLEEEWGKIYCEHKRKELYSVTFDINENSTGKPREFMFSLSAALFYSIHIFLIQGI